MVEIETIENTTTTPTPTPEQPQSGPDDIPASEERFLDAAEIESLLDQEGCIKRTTVRVQLQALAQKMRRDGNALKRVEASKKKMEVQDASASASASVSDGKAKEDEKTPEEEDEDQVIVEEVKSTPTPTPTPTPAPTKAPVQSSSVKYKTIDRFSFDPGSYGSPTVSIYITSLPNIGSLVPREQIKCTFTSTSFDLTIENYKGSNYRLLKDNLDKDIDADKCKCIVKANKIIIKLAKVKGEYGYDSWTDLTSKKTKEAKSKAAKDPSASIMELMKDMYDSGDDNMKKMIGETMLKQREGKLNSGSDGMGGMGGMDMPSL